jgi:LTXXQ motif family protein
LSIREKITMRKSVVGIVTAVLISFAPLAHAQRTRVPDQPAANAPARTLQDTQRSTDLRVRIVKGALQLTPEQEKHWAAFEEALKARSEGRQKRLAILREHMGQRDADPFQLLRERADNLAQRGAELKKLADAGQPLWQSLNADQKERMRVLGRRVVGMLKSAADLRDEEEDEDDGDDN